MSISNYCSPKCEFFKCGQRALNCQDRRMYCRWAEDDCAGASCNYTICIKGRLLPNGVCGLTIKRKTSEDFDPNIEKGPSIKLNGRLLRRKIRKHILTQTNNHSK